MSPLFDFQLYMLANPACIELTQCEGSFVPPSLKPMYSNVSRARDGWSECENIQGARQQSPSPALSPGAIEYMTFTGAPRYSEIYTYSDSKRRVRIN